MASKLNFACKNWWSAPLNGEIWRKDELLTIFKTQCFGPKRPSSNKNTRENISTNISMLKRRPIIELGRGSKPIKDKFSKRRKEMQEKKMQA